MFKHRRYRPIASTPSRELAHPTTDNLEEVEEARPPVGALSDPDATTWQQETEPKITAPVKFPSQEQMTVQLGPINLIERLKEYQSDETLAHTIIGLFVGAVLGIMADWFTKTPFTINSFSVILIIILVVISIATGIWLWRIRSRKKIVYNQIQPLR